MPFSNHTVGDLLVRFLFFLFLLPLGFLSLAALHHTLPVSLSTKPSFAPRSRIPNTNPNTHITMGAAASINKEFAQSMKKQGFKDRILNAKTDAEKIAVFTELQNTVREYYAAEKIQAVARSKLAQKKTSGGSLQEIFIKFCRFGKGQSTTQEMDGKRWVRFSTPWY